MVLDRGDSYLQSSQGYITDVQVNLDHSSKQNTVVLQRFWQKYNKFGKKNWPYYVTWNIQEDKKIVKPIA